MQKYKHRLRGSVDNPNDLAMRTVVETMSSQQMADVAAYIKTNFTSKAKKPTLGLASWLCW